MVTGEKSVFALALLGERIEADKDIVDKSWVAHDNATLGQLFNKLLYQRAEIGGSGKIIGAGESGVGCDAGAGGAVAKLRA